VVRKDAIRLVVNADDLGLHPAIDSGILRAHREGIVTSATVLVTGRSAPEAIGQSRRQGLPIGVHLCLTTGLPPASDPKEARSLAPDGKFRASWKEVVVAWLSGSLRLNEVEREFRAQIALARKLGAEPDHLDGHQHLHVLPGIAAAVRRIAREEKLPVRWPRAAPSLGWIRRPGAALKTLLIAGLSRLARDGAAGLPGIGTFEAGALTETALLALLSRLTPGSYEIGCHPGETVGAVPEQPHWRYAWDQELRALCSPRVRGLVSARGIVLSSYAQIAERTR
jgi:predicted glycoside hydrolase/deacetylase ChbG (UPF0249 family)